MKLSVTNWRKMEMTFISNNGSTFLIDSVTLNISFWKFKSKYPLHKMHTSISRMFRKMSVNLRIFIRFWSIDATCFPDKIFPLIYSTFWYGNTREYFSYFAGLNSLHAFTGNSYSKCFRQSPTDNVLYHLRYIMFALLYFLYLKGNLYCLWTAFNDQASSDGSISCWR